LIQIKRRRANSLSFGGSNAGSLPAETGTVRMTVVAEYSVVEHLRDARPIEIRALRPDDGPGMLAAIGRASTQSLRRRFFAPKKGFSDSEITFFLDIDFENHVALVAEIDEDGHPVIIGGGRYVVVRPGQAEIAFVVVDAYQAQGIGTILMRHLAALARGAGLKELIAEVLPENTAMLKLLRRFGFLSGSQRAHQVAHLTLKLV
jgi:ribosomal protein S18 acetylase RimI-like enzyme